MEPIYRTYQETDLLALIPLMKQLGYSLSEAELEGNIKALHKSHGEVFVAEYNGSVVGCICAIIDTRLAEGVQGEIVSLVVGKQARGKGVGKGLVATAEGWLMTQVKIIRIRANQLRQEAHQFYQSLGYKITKHQSILSKQHNNQ